MFFKAVVVGMAVASAAWVSGGIILRAGKVQYGKSLAKKIGGNSISIKNKSGTREYKYDVAGKSHYNKKTLKRRIRTPHKTMRERNSRAPNGWTKYDRNDPQPMTVRDLVKVHRHVRSISKAGGVGHGIGIQ